MELDQVVGGRLRDGGILNVADDDLVADAGAHELDNFGQAAREFRNLRGILSEGALGTESGQAKGYYCKFTRKTTRIHIL